MVVAVPARNEEVRLPACVASLRAAADRLPEGIEVAIEVAADSCTDATVMAAIVASEGDPRVQVVIGRWGRAGAARRAATEQGVARLANRDTATTWIANTDADSIVPPGWLTDQLAFATAGWEAVAGIVGIPDDNRRLHARFHASYPVLRSDGAHLHVHGANLGVRADAYTAVAGWPVTTPVGEDQLLWDALCAGGHRVLATTDLRVTTSNRLRARAPDGFASRLRELIA